MRSCALALTGRAIVDISVTSLRENSVVAVVQEESLSDSLTPAHESFGLNFK